LTEQTYLKQEYLPIEGHAGFIKAVQNLVFGAEHPLLKDGKVKIPSYFMGL